MIYQVNYEPEYTVPVEDWDTFNGWYSEQVFSDWLFVELYVVIGDLLVVLYTIITPRAVELDIKRTELSKFH